MLAFAGRDGRADYVTASSLADLLDEAEPTPRLVLLNSCQSGAGGTDDLFSGTAAALAHRGIQAVAAMQFAISDTAAIEFARGFYAALAHGRLGEANYQELDDPEVLRLVQACELKDDAEFTAVFPAAQGAEVEVVLADGRRLKTSLHDVVPATEADIRARFRDSAGALLGVDRADAIEEFVDRIETNGNAGKLASLYAAANRQTRSVGRVGSQRSV